MNHLQQYIPLNNQLPPLKLEEGIFYSDQEPSSYKETKNMEPLKVRRNKQHNEENAEPKKSRIISKPESTSKRKRSKKTPPVKINIEEESKPIFQEQAIPVQTVQQAEVDSKQTQPFSREAHLLSRSNIPSIWQKNLTEIQLQRKNEIQRRLESKPYASVLNVESIARGKQKTKPFVILENYLQVLQNETAMRYKEFKQAIQTHPQDHVKRIIEEVKKSEIQRTNKKELPYQSIQGQAKIQYDCMTGQPIFKSKPACQTVEHSRNPKQYCTIKSSNNFISLLNEVKTEAEEKQQQMLSPTPQSFDVLKANHNLQKQLTKINDRHKIRANIESINERCYQHDKIQRLAMEAQEKQRQEKQKATKQQKKELIIPEHHIEKQREEDSYRRIDHYKQTTWSCFSKGNQKMKRLEILNRYHYNPFEQNEGEDQCELWKKLMNLEIQNLKSQSKQEDLHGFIIDSLLCDADKIDHYRYHGKINDQDFYIETSYVPPKLNRTQQPDPSIISAVAVKEEYIPAETRKQLPISQMKKPKKFDMFGIPFNDEESESEQEHRDVFVKQQNVDEQRQSANLFSYNQLEDIGGEYLKKQDEVNRQVTMQQITMDQLKYGHREVEEDFDNYL